MGGADGVVAAVRPCAAGRRYAGASHRPPVIRSLAFPHLMRRALHIIVTAVVGCAAVLALATAVLWVRTAWRRDEWTIGGRAGGYLVSSDDGGVRAWTYSDYDPATRVMRLPDGAPFLDLPYALIIACTVPLS